MSLYFAIFDESQELVGWVFGHYSDFGYFRDKVAQVTDARFYPLFMNHSDSDGQWAAHEIEPLRCELRSISEVFTHLPAEQIEGAFEHASAYRAAAVTLYDCFHVVDGRNVFGAFIDLCDTARQLGLPILFQ